MVESPPAQLLCPRCWAHWPVGSDSLVALTSCPGCGTRTRVFVFPALTLPLAPAQPGERIGAEGEAACFYHPQKRAHVPCDACGRFLCALCDCELGDQHLCPACLESGARKRQFQALEPSRTRWDQIAWALLILPLVLCGLVVPLTSLIVLGLSIWQRGKPGSLLDNSALSLRIAAIVAALELVASSLLWVFLATGRFN